MILDFHEDVDAIIKLLHLERVIEPPDQMALAMHLVKVFDRGIAWERDRIVKIVQQYGLNPGDLLVKIRKPIR